MKLFISGQKEFVLRPLTPTQNKVKEFLDRSKDGELFVTSQLAGLIGVGVVTIRYGDVHRGLEGYSHLVKRQRYWGKPKTIKQLVKETK